MSAWWNDVRYSLRLMARSPGFTAVAVASLALGIGANSTIFSFVNAVLLRPLAVESEGELVEVYFSDSGGVKSGPWSYPDFLDVQAQSDVFRGLLTHAPTPVNLTGGAEGEFLLGESVSGNFFSVLGVPAVRGRTFLPEEDGAGAPPVAVLSYDFWQRRFGGDPALLGKSLQLNGIDFTVIGIASRPFKGTWRGFEIPLWVPMAMETRLNPRPDGEDQHQLRGRRGYFVKGRLAPGVSLEKAQAQVTAICDRLAAAYPETNQDRKPYLLPSQSVAIHPEIDRALVPVAGLLMGVVGLVLLIACSNVAGLMLVRASGRRKEIAVRLAMGASRGRLIRQLLTESVLLSLLAGLAGLLVARWTANLILAFKPPVPIPVSLDLGLDGRVLGFTLGLSLLAGLVFGLAPALQASRPDLIPTLKDDVARWGRSYRRAGLRNLLVVAQVAVSLLLLVGAGLFIRSLQSAQSIDPGFSIRSGLVLMVEPRLAGYRSAEAIAFLERLKERVESLPGVRSVALADVLPLGANLQSRVIAIDGQPPPPKGQELESDFAIVGPAYFSTLAVPILKGREFTPSDRAGAPRVAIVNETMAGKFWPGEDPLGRRFSFPSRRGPAPTLEIVGVARDGKYRTLGEEPRTYFYLPYLQEDETTLLVVASTAGSPEVLLPSARRQVKELDAKVPVIETKTITAHLDLMLFPPRMAALLLGLLGFLALVLATMGLYGVIAYSVAQRTREIGIRMALGAERAKVLRMVLGEGMSLVAIGVTLGTALALGVSRVLSGLLFGISATDPVTFLAVPLALGTVALLASLVPARRATRVDPLVALRYE